MDNYVHFCFNPSQGYTTNFYRFLPMAVLELQKPVRPPMQTRPALVGWKLMNKCPASGRTWVEAQLTWFLEGSQQDHNNPQLINPTDSLSLLPCPSLPTLYPAAWITSQINCLTPRPYFRLCFWRKPSWDFMFGVGWTTKLQGWKNPNHYAMQLV